MDTQEQLPDHATPVLNDRVSQIMAFEEGTQHPDDTVEMFAAMVRDGSAWTLQGSYGRTAQALIQQGLISPDGEVLDYPEW